MKKSIPALLFILALAGYSFYNSRKTLLKKEVYISFTPANGQNPLIYIPNLFLENNLKGLIRAHAFEMVDTSKFGLSELSYQGTTNNTKSYNIIFNSKEQSNQNLSFPLKLIIRNQSAECLYKKANGTEVKLWSSGSMIDCNVGLGKQTVYKIKTPIYFQAKSEGVILCFGNTFSNSTGAINYMVQNKQFSNFGITVSLPYTFVNSYFATNPLAFRNVGSAGNNVNLTSSRLQEENPNTLDFITKVKYTHPDSSFSVLIDLLTKIKKENNEITSVSGYSYNSSQYSSVQNIIINDLISHLKQSVNTNLLNKRLVALYQTDTLSCQTPSLLLKREILNSSEIFHFNDNLMFFLNL